VNAIAEQFKISRQAISLHLKILAECGLLHITRRGRERICEAKLDKLREVNEWVAQNTRFRTRKLDNLEDYLNNIPHHKNANHGKSTGKNIKRKRRL
jgi:DNA-binding transcriptional ArsR family regulator